MVDRETILDCYKSWPAKGPLIEGRRLTLLVTKTVYGIGEEIPVLHVLEVTKPGCTLFVMGPKPVYGEYVDSGLATTVPPDGEDPFAPGLYDGRTTESPGIDCNFEVTVYSFEKAGRHEIFWDAGGLQSNVIMIEIAGPKQQ